MGLREDLGVKTKPQLMEIAAKLGINVHANTSAEKIVSLITQAYDQPTTKPVDKHVAEKQTVAVHHNTPDDVREAIKSYLAVDGFTVDFPQDGTWSFKCKGAEDSGNMSIPLRLIVQKAQIVSRGSRRLMSMGRDNTYPGRYSDTIIAG